MIAATRFPPGVQVRVRDEQWLVRKVTETRHDGLMLEVTGVSSFVRGTAARLAEWGVGTAELTSDGPQGDGEVHIGTMHRFKGLEYQRIAIVGVREGMVPRAAIEHIRDIDPHRYRREEQKASSLLFVAATRARDTLRISWHGQPSRFLNP